MPEYDVPNVTVRSHHAQNPMAFWGRRGACFPSFISSPPVVGIMRLKASGGCLAENATSPALTDVLVLRL